jgi:hypothetical protein
MELTKDLVKLITEMCLDPSDKENMIKEVTPIAEEGDVNAQYVLGSCYYWGIFEDNEFQEAKKWLLKAANQGHCDSQLYLSFIFLQQHNYEEGFIWTSLAAEGGNSQAQNNLSVLYYNGTGVEENTEEAIRWAKLAAEQGDASEQCNLAKMLYDEDRGIQDINEAIKWFKLSADQNNAEAQCYLGMIYEKGQIDKPNYQKAFKMYSLSAEQGYSNAQYYLGCLYDKGLGVKQNYVEAYKWYKLAADKDNKEAQERIKSLISDGLVSPIDYEENDAEEEGHFDKLAIELITAAAEQGNAKSQCLLGVAYLMGQNVEQDYQKALDLFIQSADQGYAKAQYFLGVMHQNGLGVDSDYDKAYSYLKEAALNGYTESIKALKQLQDDEYEILDDVILELIDNYVDLNDIDTCQDDEYPDKDEDVNEEMYNYNDVDGFDEEENEDDNVSTHEEFLMYLEELALDPTNFRLRFKFIQYLMEMVNNTYANIDERDSMLDQYMTELEKNMNYVIDRATQKDKLMSFVKLNCLMQLGTLKLLRGEFFEAVKCYYKVIDFRWLFNNKLIMLNDEVIPDELKEIYCYAIYNIHSIATYLGVGNASEKLFLMCSEYIEQKVKFSIDYNKRNPPDPKKDYEVAAYNIIIEGDTALLEPGKAVVNFYFDETDDLANIISVDPDCSEYDYFSTTSQIILIDKHIVNGRFASVFNCKNKREQAARIKMYL